MDKELEPHVGSLETEDESSLGEGELRSEQVADSGPPAEGVRGDSEKTRSYSESSESDYESIPTPLPFTVDILKICRSASFKLHKIRTEIGGLVPKSSNLEETAYVCRDWDDKNRELLRYEYGVETRYMPAPVLDIFGDLVRIKSRGVAEEVATLEAEIEEVANRNPGGGFETYFLAAMLSYLSVAQGFDVNPDEIRKYLNGIAIRREKKAYKKARASYFQKINSKIDDIGKSQDTFMKIVDKFNAHLDRGSDLTNEQAIKTKKWMAEVNSQRKEFCKNFNKRIKNMKKLYDSVGGSFWDFRLASKEADEYMFEFLVKFIPNLCNLTKEALGS